MSLYYKDGQVRLYHGDCLPNVSRRNQGLPEAILSTLPSNSVDAVVTDPPYGINFMGKVWDSGKSFVERKPQRSNTFDHVGGNHNPCNAADAARTRRIESQRFGNWCAEWAAECLRVLKPGGHMLAFGGTRTFHRLAVAVEDAGFEIRDSIAWLYGSGFPKSLDVSKAIENARARHQLRDDGVTDHAVVWQGWGTALKPAFEPIVVARKPLAGTVASNVVEHGIGALNIDACRIATSDKLHGTGQPPLTHGGLNPRPFHASHEPQRSQQHDAGRWPTNVVLDEDQAAELDKQSGVLKSGANPTRRSSDKFRTAYGDFEGQEECVAHRGADEGGASRFFPVFRYEAKAPASERHTVDGIAHPTVKPLDLMRWLVRLVTPPGGVVLDPFAGSGTTAEACVHEHLRCITIEREADYLPLIQARLSKPMEIGFNFEEVS